MKKLFGLALIGLMATGTVSAKDTTIVRKNVESSDSYGAITVKTISSTTFTYTCNSSFISTSCEKDTTKWSKKSEILNGNENVATIDGDGETRLDAIKIPEDIAVASITYDRKFTRIYGVGYSTVTFPFSFKTECVDQTAGYGSSKSFAFYKAIGYENSSVVAKEETYEINAHQPYIVKTLLSDHTENGIEINYIKFKTSAGCSYTLKKNYMLKQINL